MVGIVKNRALRNGADFPQKKETGTYLRHSEVKTNYLLDS